MTGKEHNNFAENLDALMTKREIGVVRLSQSTGIAARLINKYRAGKTEPRDYFGAPTANAYKLAAALKVSVEDLLPPRDRQYVDRERAA